MVRPSKRSFGKIRADDLRRLGQLSHDNLKELFDRLPELGSLYRDRLLAICLCQGAAEHFVRGRNGVKDFDVWAFFRQHPRRAFPWRRRATVDFGPSRFGRNPDDVGYEGRRVDIMGRSIGVDRGETGIEAIQRYLREPPTTSAWHLSQKPVVIVLPTDMVGTTIWDGGRA